MSSLSGKRLSRTHTSKATNGRFSLSLYNPADSGELFVVSTDKTTEEEPILYRSP